MTTNEIKTKLLKYFKWERNYDIVCTEMVYYILAKIVVADLIAVNKHEIVEIEIKTSISDLRADFLNKIEKHEIYNIPEMMTIQMPNRLYYCVHKDMCNEATPIILSKNKKYGIIIYYDIGGYPYISIEKRASKLHNFNNSKLRDIVIRRVSKQFVDLHNKIYPI